MLPLESTEKAFTCVRLEAGFAGPLALNPVVGSVQFAPIAHMAGAFSGKPVARVQFALVTDSRLVSLPVVLAIAGSQPAAPVVAEGEVTVSRLFTDTALLCCAE